MRVAWLEGTDLSSRGNAQSPYESSFPFSVEAWASAAPILPLPRTSRASGRWFDVVIEREEVRRSVLALQGCQALVVRAVRFFYRVLSLFPHEVDVGTPP